MFEREIIDGRFVNRWSIVRRLREQSISEHSHIVTVYANDIAEFLGLPQTVRLAVALYAPWHDLIEEIFTGDFPGPNKRALLGKEAREAWDRKTLEWGSKTFDRYTHRCGRSLCDDDQWKVVKLVVKVADWLEAATAMATETQLGNGNTRRHIVPNMQGAVETAHELCDVLRIGRNYGDEVPFTQNGGDLIRTRLIANIKGATFSALENLSRGPWIAKEDAEREGRHDPCFGDGRKQ